MGCKRQSNVSDKVYARHRTSTRIYRGIIPPAKEFKCMDCGKQALDYDHPDYSKPDLLEPVCKKCHKKRGIQRGQFNIQRRQNGQFAPIF